MKGQLFALAKFGTVLGLSLLLVASSTARVAQPQTKEKLKAEDVVARHLEAIGTSDARSGIKTMIATGTVEVTFRSKSTSHASGTSLVASDGNKNLFSLLFSNPDYPYERIAFNGDKVTGASITPGQRTPLVNFLLGYDTIVRHGLLGGTLSMAWPLQHLAERNAKLEYGGLKKIAGRQAHELKYLPRKGSDISISLFFDAETFQHVRTEYSKSIMGQMGSSPDTSARAGTETRYKMVEEFGDFRQEGKLTVPHDYKLSLSINNVTNTASFEWEMKFTRFIFDQPIEGKEFLLS